MDIRINDPEITDETPTRPAIIRNTGTTESEKYLARLGERSFLNLWSYPNAFIDKRADGKGDGKELCDLLVVCGDHVLIFSDKTIGWPGGDDEQLAWKRWYKRAIAKSVDQIRGAERWINNFPERIFLDSQCTQPLPIKIPPPERRKVHGIAVALGAGEACKAFFGEGVGSLMIVPPIKGEEHWKTELVAPFAIGDVDPEGSFIHVLDDVSLDVVMRELDTISDLTSYLTKKEALIRSGKLLVAGGEEDLVAYFMSHMNSEDEHDFTKPDGSHLGPNDKIGLETGIHAALLKNPQYVAKKIADRNSYVWDSLIEAFTKHILAGTSIVPEGQSSELAEHEQGVRHMAVVPRFGRRLLGNAILGALELGRTADRFTRGVLPGPTERNQTTGFFFMTLALPKAELKRGYEKYRTTRRRMLEIYALAFLKMHPKLERVVGIATEPPRENQSHGSSEDLIVAEVPEWTPEMLAYLEEGQNVYDIAQPGNIMEHEVHGNEFPDAPRRREKHEYGHLNRHQRRKLAAAARTNNR
jgi:hypothetical protein